MSYDIGLPFEAPIFILRSIFIPRRYFAYKILFRSCLSFVYNGGASYHYDFNSVFVLYFEGYVFDSMLYMDWIHIRIKERQIQNTKFKKFKNTT